MRRIVYLSAALLLNCANLLAVDVEVELPSSPKPKVAQSPQPKQEEAKSTPQATHKKATTTTPAGSPASRISSTPQATHPEELPLYRPAMLGNGPDSLINRIDTQALIEQGQKDGSLMFCCSVKATGEVASAWTYNATPDTDLLREELYRRLSRSVFVPGVYNHRPVYTLFFGTVTFAIVNGKSRLRIFANQEKEELKKESDFVGPQPFVGRESKFEGIHYPDDVLRVPVDGLVGLAMKIDADGNLKELNVVSEEPPLIGFRRAAEEDFRVARFIPAFRDGKPTECNITLPVYYTP